MLNIKADQKVSVFELKESERRKNTIDANVSSSRKTTNANGEETWEYMSWKARFVGQAYEKAKTLQDKDRIILKNAAIENNYVKDTQKLWVTLVVFDFEKEA